MPSWWFEPTLALVVFGALFAMWVALPARLGEEDLAGRIRDWIVQRTGRPRG